MTTPPVLRITSKGSQASKGLGGPRLIALLAFLAPGIVFVVIVTAVAIWEGSRAAEQAALQRTRDIISRADVAIRQEMESISTVAASLAGVPILQSRPDPERARINAALFPQWIGNVVWSLDGSRALFSAMPGDGLPEIPAAWTAQVGDAAEPVVGGAERLGGLPVVLIHKRVPDDPRGLVLTIAMPPETFREMVMAELPPNAVGALVDREGNFIGRSLDQARRVATPATSYVREAVTKGGEGIYRGQTYEGMENISAYYTSGLTGWSAHVAISDRLVDAPASLAILVAVSGGVLSLGVAGLLIWMVMQDTRRRQQTELALAQAQRVESLGRLTGGIAHDFNNMLTVIIGGLERARNAPGPAQAQAIDAALGSARQAASLTRSLMLYSRQQPLAAETVNLNDCVRETADVVKRTLGAQYDVTLDLDAQAGAVRIDTAQLASALLNLAINARDAMPDGGGVTLRTRRRAIGQGGDPDGLAPGEYAEVSVADTGEGMAPDVARRAFEPFFTTKDVGKGTGLGLSQVEGFARQSGGVAEIQTAPGAGAAVIMMFPRVSDAAAVADRAVHQIGSIKALRVLLVEDNAALLDHASQLLRDQGHQVIAVGHAQSAEAALRNGRFDLLFSDIVLPGRMSGVELAEHARQIQPDIGVILATGYARDELDGREGAYLVLPKPYSAPDVVAAIERAMAERPARKRVLLVEDEPFIALGAADSLGDAGHEVASAASVEQARALVAEGAAFDVAIIDIGLPDGSGFELAVALHGEQPGLRIIISSGQAPDALPPWAELLPKPYAPEDIVAAVERGA